MTYAQVLVTAKRWSNTSWPIFCARKMASGSVEQSKRNATKEGLSGEHFARRSCINGTGNVEEYIWWCNHKVQDVHSLDRGNNEGCGKHLQWSLHIQMLAGKIHYWKKRPSVWWGIHIYIFLIKTKPELLPLQPLLDWIQQFSRANVVYIETCTLA